MTDLKHEKIMNEQWLEMFVLFGLAVFFPFYTFGYIHDFVEWIYSKRRKRK